MHSCIPGFLRGAVLLIVGALLAGCVLPGGLPTPGPTLPAATPLRDYTTTPPPDHPTAPPPDHTTTGPPDPPATQLPDHATIKLSPSTAGDLALIDRFGDAWVDDLAYSPDGSALALAGPGGVRLYDARTLALLRSLDPARALSEIGAAEDAPGSAVTRIAYSPDGRTFATDAARPAGNVLLWEASGAGLVRVFSGLEGDVAGLAFSPDGFRLAAAGWDRTLRVWEAGTGDLLLTLQGSRDAVRTLAWSPDGTLLASGGYDRALRLWRAEDGQPLGEWDAGTLVERVAFSLDGDFIALGGQDGAVQLRDLSGRELGRWQGHGDFVSGLAFSPDGSLLASAGLDGTLRLYDLASGVAVGLVKNSVAWAQGLAFSPDGTLLAAGSSDGNVRLWAPAALRGQLPTPTPQLMGGDLLSYLALPAGEYVVYSGQGPGMWAARWDASAPAGGGAPAPLTAEAVGLAVSPDGSLVQVEGDVASLLDLRSGTLARLPYGGAISPNGTMAAGTRCEHDQRIGVTYLDSGVEVCLTGHLDAGDAISYPLWSPDGRWLAYFKISPGVYTGAGPAADDGMYLVDTSCLPDADACARQRRGPFKHNRLWMQGPFVWSPDSQHIVTLSSRMHPPFEVFSLQYSKWYTTGPTAGVGDIFYFAVSPDSASIAYSRQASENDKTVDVYVMPLVGGRSERLVNSNAQALVRFWLTVGGEE